MSHRAHATIFMYLASLVHAEWPECCFTAVMAKLHKKVSHMKLLMGHHEQIGLTNMQDWSGACGDTKTDPRHVAADVLPKTNVCIKFFQSAL